MKENPHKKILLSSAKKIAQRGNIMRGIYHSGESAYATDGLTIILVSTLLYQKDLEGMGIDPSSLQVSWEYFERVTSLANSSGGKEFAETTPLKKFPRILPASQNGLGIPIIITRAGEYEFREKPDPYRDVAAFDLKVIVSLIPLFTENTVLLTNGKRETAKLANLRGESWAIVMPFVA